MVLFLAFDFYTRGFGIGNISVLALTGQGLSDFIPFRSKTINKGPKIFAARVGFALSLLALVFLMSNMVLSSQVTLGILAFFAFLEWSVGFCMGCYIYSWIVLPYFNK